MKNITTITKNIEANKDIMKYIKAENNYYSIDRFIKDSKRYIKAIKEGRMINVITSVSSSGMSRNIRFLSCEKSKENYNYQTYFSLFLALGYSSTNKDSDTFRINGCGMDMIFHTNYSIIHSLFRLGLMTEKECKHLAQKTPTTI